MILAGETTGSRLLRFDEPGIDMAFVAREAGELRMNDRDVRRHARVRHERRGHFYTDLLFALTHRRYDDRVAHDLWDALLRHRAELGRRLGRDVGISVATLDYLTNLRHEIEHPVILDEADVSLFEKLATRDGLTGLLNHAAFQLRLRAELRRALRYRAPVSLVLIDVDDFKRINDERGHPAGDRVLARIGEIVLREVREVDVAARYGGDELAIVAPSTEKAAALAAADRLRALVATALERDGITLSLGVATSPDDGQEPATLIAAADAALYAAKRAGRNRALAA